MPGLTLKLATSLHADSLKRIALEITAATSTKFAEEHGCLPPEKLQHVLDAGVKFLKYSFPAHAKAKNDEESAQLDVSEDAADGPHESASSLPSRCSTHCFDYILNQDTTLTLQDMVMSCPECNLLLAAVDDLIRRCEASEEQNVRSQPPTLLNEC